MSEIEIARKIIEDVEVWMVLGISRDAHPQAIQNAIDMHDRIRDFLGKPRVGWSDFVSRMQRLYAEPIASTKGIRKINTKGGKR